MKPRWKSIVELGIWLLMTGYFVWQMGEAEDDVLMIIMFIAGLLSVMKVKEKWSEL